MAQLEGGARAFVNRLIDGFASRGSCDFHEEFATPLPSTIFIMLMGLPHDDLPIFLQWRDNTVRPDVKPGDFEGAQKIRERTGHEITEYFQGVNEVLGAGRTGVYGGFRQVGAMFDAGLVTFGWQTYAWSAGHWDARAQIQQYRNDQSIGGVSVDFDRATTADFGQWSIQLGDFPQPDGNATDATTAAA